MKKFAFVLAALFVAGMVQAQTIEEIIAKYSETIGGTRWDTVRAMKMTANIDQGGMKIPVEVVMQQDGRMYTKITFMGKTMTMSAFDGENSWSTNFMTMKPEKSTTEDSENAKRLSKEFPNGLLYYKKLGYSPSLVGSEKIDGVDCFKIKLEKKTTLVDGVETPNTEFYYLDKESYVPILTESEIMSGDMKGKIGQTKFSDYQEINGLVIAYTQDSGVKDGQSQSVTFDTVEINPAVDESNFKFPTE
jgi:outer membrane lipoprotein-sorting protein